MPGELGFDVDVAILGGGLAGLACALALECTGCTIALFDGSDHLGGRACSVTDATTGDAIDIGPHILLTEYPNTLDLLDSLGTRQHVHWEEDRFITLLDDRKRIPMRLHRLPAPLHLLPSLLKVRQISLRDKLSNARMTWLALRASESQLLQLDRMTGLALLQRLRVSDRFQEWFWSTASLALLNLPLRECSAAALVRMYGQLIGVSAYRSGMPRRSLDELFSAPARRRLAGNAVRIELNTRARRLHVAEGGLQSIELEDGRRVRAKICVSSLAPHDLHRLVKGSALADTSWTRRLACFDPSPYISTYLWFDRKLTDERFWSRVWSARDLNSDFYDLSNIRTDLDPDRSLIASNSIYNTAHRSLSDEEIVQRTCREIRDFTPKIDGATLRHAVVHRIDMAIPCPRPDTESARPSTSTPVRGLLLAGDWTRTHLPACMESAVLSGRLAAEHAAAQLGHVLQVALPKPEADASVRWLRTLAPPTRQIEQLLAQRPRASASA